MTEDTGIQGFLPREIGQISGLKNLRFGTISVSMLDSAMKCCANAVLCFRFTTHFCFCSLLSEQLDYWLHSYRILESHGAENNGYPKLQLGRSPANRIVGTA